MVIKINYTSSDVYVSTSVSPVYVVVNYSAVNNGGGGTVSSVGLTMPSAFSVANSPVTSSGTLAVTGAGTASQYVRGDGQLATLPSNSSGGSSVAYYLNGSVAASVGTYYQMSKTPVIGTGTDFLKAGNGLISQFLTDVADPNRLEIPAGAWNFEMYFSASSSGGTPAFYVELLKYNGTTFTSIASSSAVPEAITSGTIIDLYLTSLAIPQTTLLSTDRLAIRVYIVNSTGGRTITMHTENSHLCEIITNFAGGVSALNGLTANTQYFATGTSGTDFAISSATDTHTFNLPTASATNRGALSSADWTSFNGRVPSTRTLTINGTTQDLSANRSFTVTADNIYTADGTLTANRSLTHGGFNLTFIGGTHTNRFTAAGRLLLGTTTESTFLLDVNGTARVSGAVTLSSSLTVSTNVVCGGFSTILNSSGLTCINNTDVQYRQDDITQGGHRFIINQNGTLKNVFKIFRSTNVLIQDGGTFTDTPSSQLTVESTTKGFLPPRMTNAQRTAISSPAVGLIVYCTDMVEGLYVYKSTGWTFVI